MSWTGTSAAALGPASPSVYAPPLQASATSQQSIAALSQQPPAAGDATAIPQVKRQDKVRRHCLPATSSHLHCLPRSDSC